MIIVEGPDGAGKTTLVEQLEAQYDLTREPRAVSSGAEKLKPIGQYIMEELDRGFGYRLYDRFALISSPMYLSLPNPTFSEEMLDLVWLQDMHQRFRRLDPVIIVCLPPLGEVRKNLEKSGEVDHYKELEIHWERVYWNYHNWLADHFSIHGTSIMHYDYTLTGNLQRHQEKRLGGLMRWAKARTEMGR